jgi:hypothetical protein
MHKMMKRLYLKVNSKYDTWDAIRSIVESLREFQLLLPDHLKKENLDAQPEIFQQQAIFLDFFFNHALNICCRPLLVRNPNSSVSAAVSQHRRRYCQEVAGTASNRIAIGVDYANKCGFLGAMLFQVAGICVGAAEVLAIQAIALPKESVPATEAYMLLNNLLTFLTSYPRPGPLMDQTLSILQDLVRIVNDKRKSVIAPNNGSESHNMLQNSQTPGDNDMVSTIAGDSTFHQNALEDFLCTLDGFPSLAMNEIVWMPGRTVNIWGEEQPGNQGMTSQAIGGLTGVDGFQGLVQED